MSKKLPKLKRESLKKFLQLLRFFAPYKWIFFIGLIFLFLSSAATLAFPYLLGDLIDANNQDRIGELALILLGIFLANAVFSFFRIYLFEIVTQKGLAKLRKATYENLIHLPLKFFNERRVGEISSRLTSDIALLQSTFTTSIAEFLRQIITISGGVFMLSTISIKLTLFMLAVVPVIALIAIIFGRFIQRYSKKTQAVIADSNTIVEETLQGVQNVKSFTNELFELSRYTQKVNEIVSISLKNALFRGGFVSFIIFGLFGAIVGVVWYGLILKSEGVISQGDLFSFVLYTVFVGASFGGVADVYAQIVKATGASEQLLELLGEKPEYLSDNKVESIAINGEISFENVTFAYPSRKDIKVLDNLNFHISSGKKVAFVGSSGAGKSTIISLILKFYNINNGEIKIDNEPINSFPLKGLRKQMAIVPQEVMLFGGTIEDNIKYGNPNASENEIINAAKEANAMEFIKDFPNGFKTLVGERGVQLSGGQKQRIAIARAVLRNPKILILDEATSALDSKSEKLVQDALEKLMQNRTSIIIAHRLSTIKNADKIMVIEKGKLIEEGTYEQLISKNEGVFKSLAELQQTS